LLGRTQILEDCWLYLDDQGLSTGLITILPFDLDQARAYIDAFNNGVDSGHAREYREVRDMILETLGAAFKDSSTNGDQDFFSFIGYPPVLDAIVTLLQTEPNYHRIRSELNGSGVKDIEIQLLFRIASYILRREKDQKVIPNILTPLISDLPPKERETLADRVFEPK
jgi:hypothetical protein